MAELAPEPDDDELEPVEVLLDEVPFDDEDDDEDDEVPLDDVEDSLVELLRPGPAEPARESVR